jgi:hypothetical protein
MDRFKKEDEEERNDDDDYVSSVGCNRSDCGCSRNANSSSSKNVIRGVL